MTASNTLNIIEIDKTHQTDWENILLQFDDANLYQTIEYGMNYPGGKNLSHLIVKKMDKIIGAAQVRIIRLPLVNRGIAYVFWGPLWRCTNELPDVNNLYSVLNALYAEYVIKRKYLLRIVPNIIINQLENIKQLFDATNHVYKRSSKGEQTIFVDIAAPLEELRKNLRGNWRGHLNRAEKNNLKIVQGNDINLYNDFQNIYLEMHSRKQFSDAIDVSNFGCIQNELSPEFKMQVFICYSGDEPLAASVCTGIGNTGIYLLGATTNHGMKTQASYLIQWKMIQWLKTRGFRWYDLGGIDPENNPGVFHFKEGIGGQGVNYLGQFDAWQSPVSWAIVRIGYLIKKMINTIKGFISFFKLLC